MTIPSTCRGQLRIALRSLADQAVTRLYCIEHGSLISTSNRWLDPHSIAHFSPWLCCESYQGSVISTAKHFHMWLRYMHVVALYLNNYRIIFLAKIFHFSMSIPSCEPTSIPVTVYKARDGETQRYRSIQNNQSYHAVMSSTSASPKVLDFVSCPTPTSSWAPPSTDMMSGRISFKKPST
jgi:hypothetical protein